jgi:hypothetical protein
LPLLFAQARERAEGNERFIDEGRGLERGLAAGTGEDALDGRFALERGEVADLRVGRGESGAIQEVACPVVADRRGERRTGYEERQQEEANRLSPGLAGLSPRVYFGARA